MRILMTGATGLVGQGVLLETLAHPDVSHVAVLGRREIRQDDPRVDNLLVERFDELGAVVDRLAPFDACFYCAGAPPLGTPEERYRHVTHDLTLHVARAYAQRNPRSRLIYISGAHADPASRFMPLRVKGDTEAALAALPITTVMLRPGGIQPSHGERSPHAWMWAFYAIAVAGMRLGVRLFPLVMT